MLSHSSVVLLFSAFSAGSLAAMCFPVSVGTFALKPSLKRLCRLIVSDPKQTSWRQSVGSPWCSTQWAPLTSKRDQGCPLISFTHLFFIFSSFADQSGQFAAMWSHFRRHHGGGGQRELHDRRGGLHGRREDHRQRPDPLQVCFALTFLCHLTLHLKLGLFFSVNITLRFFVPDFSQLLASSRSSPTQPTCALCSSKSKTIILWLCPNWKR